MHHSDDTSEATQATQDERLRKCRLSENPRSKTSPRQILEALYVYNQKFLDGRQSSRAQSCLGTKRFQVHEVCDFPSSAGAIGATPEALFFLPPFAAARNR